MFGLVRRTLRSRPDGSVLKAFIFGDAYDMSTTKQVPPEERAYPLSLAGNPAGGEVFPLTSIPGAYRITIRHNPYCAARKRSVTKRTTYGVVIRDKFYFIDEYHQRFTKRGRLRASVPPSAPRRARASPGKKTLTIELPGRASSQKPDACGAEVSENTHFAIFSCPINVALSIVVRPPKRALVKSNKALAKALEKSV